MCHDASPWSFSYGDRAPMAHDSPTDIWYTANFNGSVSGTMNFWSTRGNVEYDINLHNLPKKGGPFSYHVQDRSINVDGVCTKDLSILDPYAGCFGANYLSEHPVGDLSGKYGKFTSQNVSMKHLDEYISLNPTNKAYIGNLSIAVQDFSQKTVACANIRQANGSHPVPYSDVGKIAMSIGAWIPMAASAALFL